MSIHRVAAIPDKFKKGRKARTSAPMGSNAEASAAPAKGKPFIVSDDYVDWAHGSAAEDGQALATKLFEQPIRGKSRVIDDPKLVAGIADVAELYVGGSDSDLRAARVRKRAIQWLLEHGLTVRQALAN